MAAPKLCFSTKPKGIPKMQDLHFIVKSWVDSGIINPDAMAAIMTDEFHETLIEIITQDDPCSAVGRFCELLAAELGVACSMLEERGGGLCEETSMLASSIATTISVWLSEMSRRAPDNYKPLLIPQEVVDDSDT